MPPVEAILFLERLRMGASFLVLLFLLFSRGSREDTRERERAASGVWRGRLEYLLTLLKVQVSVYFTLLTTTTHYANVVYD